jgi:hypothetical protein
MPFLTSLTIYTSALDGVDTQQLVEDLGAINRPSSVRLGTVRTSKLRPRPRNAVKSGTTFISLDLSRIDDSRRHLRNTEERLRKSLQKITALGLLNQRQNVRSIIHMTVSVGGKAAPVSRGIGLTSGFLSLCSEYGIELAIEIWPESDIGVGRAK